LISAPIFLIDTLSVSPIVFSSAICAKEETIVDTVNKPVSSSFFRNNIEAIS